MKIEVKRCPVEGVRIDAMKEACVKDIDNFSANEAIEWCDNLLKAPEGRDILIKYLFYKMHNKI